MGHLRIAYIRIMQKLGHLYFGAHWFHIPEISPFQRHTGMENISDPLQNPHVQFSASDEHGKVTYGCGFELILYDNMSIWVIVMRSEMKHASLDKISTSR